MDPALQELLELVKQAAPPEAEEERPYPEFLFLLTSVGIAGKHTIRQPTGPESSSS